MNHELDAREGHDGKVPGEEEEPQVGSLCLNSHPEEQEQEARRTWEVRGNDTDRESGLKEFGNARNMELSIITLKEEFIHSQ